MPKSAALLGIFSLASTFLFSGCVMHYDQAELSGVPGWMMDGAEFEEPPRRAPDSEHPYERTRTGPVGIEIEEFVESPEQARKRKRAVNELFNR